MTDQKPKKYDGGPAYPSHGTMGEVCHQGITMRDYFAAKAMQSLLSLCVNDDREGCSYEEYIAKEAYRTADAMIIEGVK